MTEAAGVIAVVTKQSNSTATAAVADEYGTVFTETCSDPHNAEALNVAVTAHDFEAGSG